MSNTHEQLSDLDSIVGPTNNNFGLTMTFAFILLAVLCKFKFDTNPSFVATSFTTGTIFFFVTWFFPNKLTVLNKYWARFGKLLHKIVTPLIMQLVYTCVFLPIGIILKLSGKNTMQVYKDGKTSYWQPKAKSELPEPMKYQF